MKKEKIELFNQISSYASCLGDNWDKVLESALIIHGHLCGAIIVLVETGSFHAAGCFTDGVQFATGCTYGKGLIEKLEYGKWAATVVIKENGRAVRVSVKPEAVETMFASKFMAERKKGIPPAEVNPEFILEPFKKTITRPDEEFLAVSDIFTYEFPSVPASSFNIEKCEICGEMVAENKLRIKDGKKVCIPCSGYEM